MRIAITMIIGATLAACSLQRPADVNDDGGTGRDAPTCSATSCTSVDPVCETSGLCGSCTGEPDCGRFSSDGLPHCASTGACVECRDSNDCPLQKPFCNNFTCEACQSDNDCASDACEQNTGTCFPDGDTLYVELNATGDCSKASPCGTLGTALTKVTSSKKYIKVGPGTYNDDALDITNKTVVISGPGATIGPLSTNRNIVNIDGTSDVTVYDVTFAGTALKHVGIECKNTIGGAGPKLTLVHATVSNAVNWAVEADTCTLDMERSLITLSMGGLHIANTSNFVVRNNFIVYNAGVTPLGGVLIESVSGNSNVFEYNTVAGNVVLSGAQWSGMSCVITGAMSAHNNIIYGNMNGAAQVSCNWDFNYSIIGPETHIGAMNVDPMFTSPSTYDYHLKVGSPARNTADPASTVMIDYDGEVRPQGTGREPGADEIP